MANFVLVPLITILLFCQRIYIKYQLGLDLPQKICKISIGFTAKIYMSLTSSHPSVQNYTVLWKNYPLDNLVIIRE